jgi:DmsE family decaheme c-type cytochrome
LKELFINQSGQKAAVLQGLIFLLLIFVTPLHAQDYTELGADSCLPCHGEGSPKPATDIFNTPHASKIDPDAPFSSLQCESCHGPGQEHVFSQQRGINQAPAFTFGTHAQSPAAEQNQVCLTCHESGGRVGWEGSSHDQSGVACASCHQIHIPMDRVFESSSQQEACFDCHPRKRSDTLKSSSHPLRFGSMSCSDCHDPHNGHNDSLLQQSTVNETCYTCHAEKQGPYLWEHAPASEDCALCHQPHGSNHPAMLKRRPPLLCQQCHSAAGHPGVAYTSEEANDDFLNRFMLARGCLNCHSQVHGSNHPSGSTLHR